MSDEESKLGCTGVKSSSVLGKRAVRKWEKRWVLQPNVFDLNEGEIWVQKWVQADKARADQQRVDELTEKISQEMAAEAHKKQFVSLLGCVN